MTPVITLLFLLACGVCFWCGRMFERLNRLVEPKKTDPQVGTPKPIRPPESPKTTERKTPSDTLTDDMFKFAMDDMFKAIDNAPKKTTVKSTTTTVTTMGSPIGCPVENCRIQAAHSHTQALIERLKGK